MQTIVNYIYNYFNTEPEKIDEYLFKFGISALISSIFTFCTVLITSTLLNNLKESLLYIVLFIPVRMPFDGFHCKKLWTCSLTFNLFLQFNVLIFQNKLLQIFDYTIINLILLFIIIMLYKSEFTNDKYKILYLLSYYFFVDQIVKMKLLLFIELYSILFLRLLSITSVSRIKFSSIQK